MIQMQPTNPHRAKQARAKQAWAKWGWWTLPGLGLAVLVGWLVLPPAGSVAPGRHYDVSQHGREFRPGLLDIQRGDVVRVVNDDEDLPHHAYVASERFKFDSGDQEPGHDVDIPFTVAGTFSVLCGIHPKMHLTVHVH